MPISELRKRVQEYWPELTDYDLRPIELAKRDELARQFRLSAQEANRVLVRMQADGAS